MGRALQAAPSLHSHGSAVSMSARMITGAASPEQILQQQVESGFDPLERTGK